LVASTLALADDHHDEGDSQGGGAFNARLTGYNEIPAVLTTGAGKVRVIVSSDQTSLDVTLDFTNLVGVAQSASLYLGLPGTAGGVAAHICGGTKPACPTTASGAVTVTLASSDVLAISTQGLAVGDLTSFLQALSNNSIYANVLTNKFPNGEIRGQVQGEKGDD
jgi:hypothetical protein